MGPSAQILTEGVKGKLEGNERLSEAGCTALYLLDISGISKC